MEVLGSVRVLGLVAAAHVATRLAHAQVHPGIAEGHALGANMLRRSFQVRQVERQEVGTGRSHRKSKALVVVLLRNSWL
jgi:hypothetical protein